MVWIWEDSVDLEKRKVASRDIVNDDDKPAARLMDLTKAYSRVNELALWTILRKYGIGDNFLRVLKDLHETTVCSVKSKEGESDSWLPRRGLREGCPSSPPSFNIFHQVPMRIGSKKRRNKLPREVLYLELLELLTNMFLEESFQGTKTGRNSTLNARKYK